MTESESNQRRSRITWQVYLGVGILSALAGYVVSAYPLLIGGVPCAALAIWLISSGLRERIDIAERSGPKWRFWRSIWRSREGRLRYGIQS
jgi:hypothetical protein